MRPPPQTILAAALLIGLQVNALADEIGPGERAYRDACANCHGEDGRGEGPIAFILFDTPTDLSQLALRNGGEFPYQRVMAIIDGRYVVPGHGDREMPVWGDVFRTEHESANKDVQAATDELIGLLAEYVARLQRR